MTNYITLFQSKKPLTSNHPIQSGRVKIEEALQPGEYEFGLYDKTSKNGIPYRSGKIMPIYKKEVEAFSEPKETKKILNHEEDSMPF